MTAQTIQKHVVRHIFIFVTFPSSVDRSLTSDPVGPTLAKCLSRSISIVD